MFCPGWGSIHDPSGHRFKVEWTSYIIQDSDALTSNPIGVVSRALDFWFGGGGSNPGADNFFYISVDSNFCDLAKS